MLERIQNLEIIEAEMKERLKIGCQIVKQMLKEIRDSDLLINQGFLKINDQSMRKTSKQKREISKEKARKNNSRITVCNVPQKTPKLIIDKMAVKISAKQKKPISVLTPNGLDEPNVSGLLI